MPPSPLEASPAARSRSGYCVTRGWCQSGVARARGLYPAPAPRPVPTPSISTNAVVEALGASASRAGSRHPPRTFSQKIAAATLVTDVAILNNARATAALATVAPIASVGAQLPMSMAPPPPVDQP